MNNSSQSEGGAEVFQPMVQIDLEVQAFLSTWTHCDQISTYSARMISHNRADSVRHSTLFSSAVNELLEVAFRTRHSGGEIACRVSRRGETDRIELRLPCMPEELQFYEEAVSQIAGSDGMERYLNSVSGDLAPSREIVLLGLAIDYNATVRVETTGSDVITLVVDLPLQDLQN